MTTQQLIFIQCRKMKFTWSVHLEEKIIKGKKVKVPFTVVPVDISTMADRCECNEEDVIEAIKFIIDSGYDENDKDPFCIELTNDYTGIVKKQSFNERMADDHWVSAWMKDPKSKGKFCYIFDQTYLSFKHYEKSENS